MVVELFKLMKYQFGVQKYEFRCVSTNASKYTYSLICILFLYFVDVTVWPKIVDNTKPSD